MDDLEEAFDHINWTNLFKIFEETEIDDKGKLITHTVYEEQEANNNNY